VDMTVVVVVVVVVVVEDVVGVNVVDDVEVGLLLQSFRQRRERSEGGESPSPVTYFPFRQ